MNKQEFLIELCARLSSLSEEDSRRSLDYYSEMIDDRMEDGLSEEEAVAAIGELDEIIKDIILTASPVRTQQPVTPSGRQLRWWEITLLILGAPLWLSLVIAVAAVIFSVWICLWSGVICLYAVVVALGASAVGCIVGCFFMVRLPGATLTALGAALICAGLAVFFVLLSNLAAKGMVRLTLLTGKGIKGILTRKEQRR